MRALIAAAGFVVGMCPPVFAMDIALIVNQANPTSEVSLHEAERIFRHQRQRWNDGTRIVLALQEPARDETDVILRTIYGMRQESDLPAMWLGIVFRQEAAAPIVLGSNEAILRFVHRMPGAIGFIDATRLDSRVKALRVDGKLPGEEGYLLTDAPPAHETPVKE